MKKNVKESIAKRISHTAKTVAEKTVGKSLPMGAHEVSVPEELMYLQNRHEADQ